MYQLLMILHVLIAFCLVALVLVQQGKGATVGAAFGSGASQTVFGSRGSGSFLLKLTISFGMLFFVTSIALNYMASQAVKAQTEVVLPMSLQEDLKTKNTLPVSPSNIPLSTPMEQKK